MRRTTVLACAVALLLLVPLAAAAREGVGRSAERPQASAHADDATNGGAEDHKSGFLATLKALRASWLANASEIREACHATEKGDDASKEARLSWAHCIREAFSLWRAEHRVELREMRDEARAFRGA